MSAHGSDASQGSHIAESLAVYLFGAFIWPWGPAVASGLLANLAFTTGKELPQMYAKGFKDLKGDWIDTAVHIGTSLLAAGIHLLVT